MASIIDELKKSEPSIDQNINNIEKIESELCPPKYNWSSLVLGILLIISLFIIIYLINLSSYYKNHVEIVKLMPISSSSNYTYVMKSVLDSKVWTGEQLEIVKKILKNNIRHINLDKVLDIDDYRTMMRLMMFIDNITITTYILNSIEYTTV